jgi:hypothetical protein
MMLIALRAMKAFHGTPEYPDLGYLEIDVLVPTIILYSILFLIESFYKRLSFRLTKWENYKTYEEFENSYIIKNFFFKFVNRLGPPTIISFLLENDNPNDFEDVSI